MKLIKILLLATCAFAMCLATSQLHAQGTAFTYQGRLNINGQPANGIYNLSFALWDSSSGGNQVGVSLTNSATAVTNGLFTVTLDYGSVFSGTSRWLEMGVQTNTEPFAILAPRQKITPTPYAIYTATAGAAVTATTATSATSATTAGSATTATSAITATTANSFSGSLSGDVTGTQSSTAVAAVGGQTAANIASGVSAANAATSANTASTIVKRDASGNFSAGTITANFIGNGSGLTSVSGAISWQIVSGTTQTASANQAYLLTNNVQTTLTLPVSPNVGDIVTVSGVGTGGWQVSPNTGQMIVGYAGAGGLTWTARASNQNWYSVASSSDGTKLAAVGSDGSFYTSSDSGVTWGEPIYFPLNWLKVASSADGTKLVLAPFNYNGSIYTSTNSGATLTARFSAQNGGWVSLASSADGTKLAATDGYGNGGIGQIYTSTNSGVSWSVQNSAPLTNWTSIASSADGTKLAATTLSGQLYTSINSGVTWTAQSSDSQNWEAIASSADGTKLVAAPYSAPIYTSTNSGVTWTAQNSGSRGWYAVASSADGTRLVATVFGGQIYTSTNSGITWAAQNSGSQNWFSVASSADGTKLVAAAYGGQIYTSGPMALPFVGIAGATVQFQYIGNNLWQPLNESVSQIIGGLTTNLLVLIPGGGTNTLCFTNGILMNVQ